MQTNKISYVEFPSRDLAATKAFFRNCFGWDFTDYGPEYTSFDDQGVAGGFFLSEPVATTSEGAPLIVLYSDAIEATQAAVEQHGGKIVKPIFEFPGGRRFQFTEPGGNELAVWTDK